MAIKHFLQVRSKNLKGGGGQKCEKSWIYIGIFLPEKLKKWSIKIKD